MIDKIQAPTLPAPILHREEIANLLAEAIGISQTNQPVPYKLILLCATWSTVYWRVFPREAYWS